MVSRTGLIFLALLALAACSPINRPGLTGPFFDRFSWTQSGHGYLGQNSGIIIKVEVYNLTPGMFDDKLKNELALIDSLYEMRLMPYSDLITDRVVCPDTYMPAVVSMENEYHLLYSSERFTYGACSPDLIRYRSIITSRYCDGNGYIIKLFAPVGDDGYYLKELEGISC